jgi:hypothetical protein
MADETTTDNLTPAQYRAVSSLLTEGSIRKAAEAAGVKERTLYHWLKQPMFADEYRDARREAVKQATARLQQASSAAVTVLCQLMVRDTVNPAVRRAAARDILDLAFRAIELEDLEARLIALEERYAHT